MVRSNAVLKQVKEQDKLLDIDDYVDFLNKHQKKLKRTHHSGLMKFDFESKNTSYLSRKQLEQEKDKFKSLSDKQFIWDGIISISNEMANKYKFGSCESFDEIVQKFMPSFLKAEGLDPKNIEFYASVHGNTKNPHLHWLFFEKEPTIQKTKNDEPSFKKKGKLKLENALKFSYFASKYVDNKSQTEDYYQLKNDFWSTKNALKTEIKNQEIKFDLFTVEILEVLDEVKEKDIKTFKNLSNKSKQAIMDYFEEQMDNYFSYEIQQQYEAYKAILQANKNDERFLKDAEEFNTFIGNKILRDMKQSKYEFDQWNRTNEWERKKQQWIDSKRIEREREKHRKELEWLVKQVDFKKKQQMFNKYKQSNNRNKYR